MNLFKDFAILASGKGDIFGLAIRCGILLAILIVAFVIVRIIQKKLDPRRQDDTSSGGMMTMEQLDAMHEAGHISDDEFSRMRRVILGLPETKEKSSDCSTDVVIMPDSIELDNTADKNNPADGVEKEES